MFSTYRTALLALCLLLAGPAWSQGDTRPVPERMFFAMQGFAAPNLSGTGLSSAFGVRIADVGAVNPAALSAFERPTVGLSYQVETGIGDGYIASIGYGPLGNTRPRSAAVAVPFGDWTFGLSYSQRYAAELDFGTIPIRTLENPSGEAGSIDIGWQSRVETIAPQIAYQTSLATGGTLSLGVRVGFGFARFDSDVETEGEIEAGVLGDFEPFSAEGTHVAIGVSHRTDQYGIAGFYESELEVSGEQVRRIDFTFPGTPQDIREIAVPIADALPARLGISAEFAASTRLRLGAGITRVFWESTWEEEAEEDSDFLEDGLDAALWGRLDLSEQTLLSFGLLSQDRNRWGDEVSDRFEYSGRAIYTTLGGAVTFDRFRLDAVVADSHLLGASEQRQTIVKVGASIRL